jgi:large subunit ribosomal protein L10
VTTLPTPAKEATIAELSAELGRIQGAIVTDYRGLTVEQITALRKRLRPVGGRYQVVKNTLLKRAMNAEGLPDLGGILEGPSAVLFSEGDPVEATKILAAFVKELRKDLPQIKGGFLGQRVMSPTDVANLATLPPREQILANFLGTVQSPVSNVVTTIGAVLQNLVGTIEAYQAKASGA